ncbi:extracellular calcium-sensing receptor-like [Hyla sarda]|uniref:extracellular calcium-sensing receptor-like n=1 Tax=Hyla sarda TaxID=327740 RepID=UPI0024C2D2F9|nr:extracellular calcium-sensing receptor-like [Hyla sarda]
MNPCVSVLLVLIHLLGHRRVHTVCIFCCLVLTMLLLLFVLCVTFCISEIQDPAAQCHLTIKNYTFDYKYSQEGDIIIGGIFTVHSWVKRWKQKGRTLYNRMCIGAHPREYTHLRAFLFAIEEINNSSDILPNVTLGYHIYDSCGHENKVIKDVLQILSGHTVTAPNYSCMENDAVVGFIGDLHSGTSLPMAQLLSLYGYTQISYGAREPLLSNKRLYPNFFRTVPDEKIQYAAYVKLLERFQWNWVGIITSDDDSGRRELQELVKLFTSHQICIEFTFLVSENNLDHVPPALKASSTDVIIICGSYSLTYIKFLYNVAPLLKNKNKTLILPSSWSLATDLIIYRENGSPGNCSLVFSIPINNITKKEFLNIVQLCNQPSDPLLEDLWMTLFHCYTGNKLKDFLMPLADQNPYCHCSEEMKLNKLFNFSGDATPYQVYIAVYIMAQALHKLNIFLNYNKKTNASIIYDYKRWVSIVNSGYFIIFI